ncbi:hypothetical protein [Flavobacterium denitrificans]|uniref:hypothetical protein n=1 Tax=Flavobacterium denitrificans TaxID=281361 RepID=UPI00041C067F|nr:hypothetical protein [Flavobacterium denitrificans]
MQTVPVSIRPHLVPFFFKSSEGKEASYGNKKVKSVLYSSTASSVGRMMRLLMVKADKPLDVKSFNLFLTVSDCGGKKKYKGDFYRHVNGKNHFLYLPEDANNDINDLLEDIFRMAFFYYVLGSSENDDDEMVTRAINSFIDKYDLLEFGFSTDTLRRLYYREKKKDKPVSRFQALRHHTVLNYAS